MLMVLDREGVALAFRRKAVRVFHETPLQINDINESLEDPTHEVAIGSPSEPVMSAVSEADLES